MASLFYSCLDHLLLPWRQRALLQRLVWREIVGHYRGSWLGLGWSFAMPLFMLAIYTFVFGVVFQARWQPGGQDAGQAAPLDFALTLFAGLIVFNFFAEVTSRAPGLVVTHPNYVKKVVFPLELLPLAATGAALFHALVSFAILLAALAVAGKLSVAALAAPFMLVPLALFTLGLAWFLASLGVFLRDVGQLVGPAVTALLFLSPVFYPVSALPERMQPWLFLNPLTVPIEATRALTFGAQMPDWPALGAFGLISAACSGLGWFWFAKTQKGFADVL